MRSILYVLPSLGAGGAERAAILVANELTRQYGYTVSFFLFADDLYNRPLLDPSVRVHCSHCYNDSSRWQRIVSMYGRFAYHLNRHLREHQYDIVISGYELNGELPLLEIIVKDLLRLRAKRTKFVSVIQNSLRGLGLAHAAQRQSIVLAVVAYLRWRLFDRIIVVSRAIEAECPAFIRHAVVAISNPVDRASIINRANDPLAGFPTDAENNPYFVNIARISHQKNQLCLLRAFNAIKTKTNWNLVLIGHITDKEYFRNIEAYIRENGLQERVVVAGTLPNPYPCLRHAGAFVFSSRYEGNPLAVIEALVLQKLIVSTKFIGYENILSAENAILIDNENEEQLAAAMAEAARGNAEYTEVLSRTYASTDNYDIATIAQQYHAQFSAL